MAVNSLFVIAQAAVGIWILNGQQGAVNGHVNACQQQWQWVCVYIIWSTITLFMWLSTRMYKSQRDKLKRGKESGCHKFSHRVMMAEFIAGTIAIGVWAVVLIGTDECTTYPVLFWSIVVGFSLLCLRFVIEILRAFWDKHSVMFRWGIPILGAGFAAMLLAFGGYLLTQVTYMNVKDCQQVRQWILGLMVSTGVLAVLWSILLCVKNKKAYWFGHFLGVVASALFGIWGFVQIEAGSACSGDHPTTWLYLQILVGILGFCVIAVVLTAIFRLVSYILSTRTAPDPDDPVEGAQVEGK